MGTVYENGHSSLSKRRILSIKMVLTSGVFCCVQGGLTLKCSSYGRCYGKFAASRIDKNEFICYSMGNSNYSSFLKALNACACRTLPPFSTIASYIQAVSDPTKTKYS